MNIKLLLGAVVSSFVGTCLLTGAIVYYLSIVNYWIMINWKKIIFILINLVNKMKAKPGGQKEARKYNYGCEYGKNGNYCDECGVSFASTNIRVIGGSDAVPHSYPANVGVF